MPKCILTFGIIGLVSGCEDHQMEDNGSCCNLCPPGFYLEEFCSQQQQTICSPCKEGFFSDRNHSLDRCEECQSCEQDNQVIAEKCTATTDAKCSCHPGFLCSNKICSTCVEIKCNTGYKPKKRVNSSNEELEEYSYECEPLCPENAFFDAGSCKPRTQCRSLGLTERFPGNETHDSVCDKPVHDGDIKDIQSRDRDSSHIFLGLGFIILSVTTLSFLFYQCVKKLKKHRANGTPTLAVADTADDFHLSKEETGHLFIIQDESEDSKSGYAPV